MESEDILLFTHFHKISPLKFTEILRQLQLQQFHHLAIKKVLLAGRPLARKSKGRYDQENFNNQTTGPAHDRTASNASDMLAFGSSMVCWATFPAEVMQAVSQEAVKSKRFSLAIRRSSSAVKNTHKIL